MESKCPICKQDFSNCACKKKGKKILFLLVIFLAIYLGIIHAAKIYVNGTNPHTIVVSGKGEIEATPDIATISFTIRSSSADADTQKLQNDLANISGSVIPKIKALGIDEKDIKTENYSVNPKYGTQSCSGKVQSMIYPPIPCSNSVVTGYEASEMITVKVRDTKNVAKILSALAEGKITEVNGPSFDIDNVDKIKADARDMAIKDAKEKAKILGKSLGVHLEKIISFSEDNVGGAYPMMMKAVAMDTSSNQSPNIEAGSQKVTSNVSITFEIDN